MKTQPERSKPTGRGSAPYGTIPNLTGIRLDPNSSETAERLAAARALLSPCAVCPRVCGSARLAGETGSCRAGSQLTVASWNPHHGEEPPISGQRGSGTIFLSGCSLRCIYCQNYPISQMGTGEVVTIDQLVGIMLGLADRGVHNINFVTPTHYTTWLMEAIINARVRGLSIPIVWNTSGYERVETLRLLEGLVDIYLADMRYSDKSRGQKYSLAADYPAVNRAAILEMHRQVGLLRLNDHGVATRGLLVRHLVLPHNIAGSAATFRFLSEEVSRDTRVSVMSQYFPAHRAVDDPVIGRRLQPAEYEAALKAFDKAGLHNGYVQGL